jgi:hypothetical protein
LSPVRYELGFGIPEGGILSHCREIHYRQLFGYRARVSPNQELIRVVRNSVKILDIS